jgi:hypothetical protein
MKPHRVILPAVALSMWLAHTPARAERMSYLDNGSIRIGVDLDIGGTITFLARSNGGENVINSHDLGRQVQQSYYSGPQPFGRAHPAWKDWPWNPAGSGDVYDNPSRVIKSANNGRSLYVKTIPMQWALNKVPGECTYETWITLRDKTVVVTCRLENHRPDKTQYPARDQELPAAYTIGKLHRLITYVGDRPFEGQPLVRIPNAGPPWAHFTASENWAALVDDQGFGMGVIHPGVYSFQGGFAGQPGIGGPKDDPTGYIAPSRQEILDHDIVYVYRYILAVGSLDEIRAAATANRIEDTRPDYHFTGHREHWIYKDARDSGPPIEGGLRVQATGKDAQMIGPEQWWRAEGVPKLFIRAAFRTRGDRAAIAWSVPGGGFRPDRRVEFAIRPDGEYRNYEIDLAKAPGYRGIIAGLRLDLPAGEGRFDGVRVVSISWKPD